MSPATLQSMLARLDHRGPDDRGLKETGSFALGMTRLAILDRERGQQPFVSGNGQVTVVCNGEIYNWRNLRTALEEKGHRFSTSCDCEILPAAWLEWGEKLPERLNGMFALAIHDARSDCLFLARDRCGQKPLYYSDQGGFVFASEAKALAAGGVRLTPNLGRLSQWLSLRYLPGEETLFEGVFNLPAAHSLMVDRHGNRTLKAYWEPLGPDADLEEKARVWTEKEALDELDRLARSSVELALQADVPIAAYLSGGIDSSLLVHYVNELGGDVSSVAIGFGAASDETESAASFAKSLSISHSNTFLEPQALQELPRVVSQMDDPVGDALILAFDQLASHTRSLGCKVALGGEGPDEHFAGYSFQKAYLGAARLPSWARQFGGFALKKLPNSMISRLAQFPADLGEEGRLKVARYLGRFSELSTHDQRTGLHHLFDREDQRALLTSELLEAQKSLPAQEDRSGRTLMDNTLAAQYSGWLPDWSLIRQDRNTMAHSLEYRAPFLDHRLIDFAFTLPDDFKIRGGADKYLWRALAHRHLHKPDAYCASSMSQRAKQPFYLPLENQDWRRELMTMARDYLTPAAIANRGWFQESEVEKLMKAHSFLPMKKLATLVILEIWCRSCE